MIPDFQNFTLDHCKDLIVKFQETNDPSISSILLARFDRYILYVIYEMRKKTPYLQSEEPQDLYQTGVVGFYKGISAFKTHLKPFFVILVIKAYIKSELKQTYSYKNREAGYEVLPEVASTEETGRELDSKLLFEFIEGSSEFSAEEKVLITLRFKEDQSVKEISKTLNCLSTTVYKKLERIMLKLKQLFPESTLEDL